MMSRSLFLLAAALPLAPVAAAERSVAITNFDRIRVDGPYDVRVTTRAIPGATVSGDARVLESVSLRVEGGTLVVRAGIAGWGERPQARGLGVPVVTIRTRDLRSVGLVGGGTLTVAGPVAGARIDLTVTGGGTLAIPALDAGDLVATLIGNGALSIGGTARSARLLANGGGRIAAAALTANDVTVRTEGSADVTVTARYTAAAVSTGIGPITILGRPECKVSPRAVGPILCQGAARGDRR